MLQDVFGTLFSPQATMTRLAGAAAVRGLVPVLLAGAGWAAFSATLARFTAWL